MSSVFGIAVKQTVPWTCASRTPTEVHLTIISWHEMIFWSKTKNSALINILKVPKIAYLFFTWSILMVGNDRQKRIILFGVNFLDLKFFSKYRWGNEKWDLNSAIVPITACWTFNWYQVYMGDPCQFTPLSFCRVQRILWFQILGSR